MDRAALRGLLSTALDAGLDALADGLAAALPPAPAGPVRMVPLDELAVRPAVYQFRLSCIGKSGTDGRLRDCGRFRRELAGVVLVWEEAPDVLALLDGHHRLELARRDGVPDLACLVVEARSVREARRVGALANVAAGTAAPADLAKLLRDDALSAGDLAAFGISRRSKLVTDAAQLALLPGDLFGLACTGEIDLPMALALASAGESTVMRDLHREATRRRWSPAQVAEAAQLARMATVSTTTADGCLPGFHALLAQSNSNLSELLAVRAAIRRTLAGELQALSTVSRRRSAASLEARGVAVVDVEAAAEARDSSRAQSRVFDQLAGMSGGLHQVIAELAGQVTESRSAADVVAANIDRVRRAIEAELG